MGGDVERVEVVMLGLDHRDRPSVWRIRRRDEEIFELLLNLRHRMQAAGAHPGLGRREVDPLGFETGVERGGLQARFALFVEPFEFLLVLIEELCPCARALRA